MAEDKQEAPVLFVDARNILRDDKLPTYLVGVRVWHCKKMAADGFVSSWILTVEVQGAP